MLDQVQAREELRQEFAALLRWLKQFGDLEVAELCALSTPPAGKPKTKTPTKVDEAAVDEYLGKLSRSTGDRGQFELVLSQLSADNRIKKGEIIALAQRYVGGTTPYKSKVDALKEIRLRFGAGVLAGARLKAASDIY